MGWEVDMIGGGATNNKALVTTAGPDAAAGFYFLSLKGQGDLTDETSLKFFEEYRKRHKDMPSSVWPVMAGDAFKILVEAVANTQEPTSKNLAAYPKKDLKDFEGFTGPMAFNEKGDRIRRCLSALSGGPHRGLCLGSLRFKC